MFRQMFAAAIVVVPATAVVAAAPMSAPTYIAKAGASDQYEIQSSRLMMNSTNADVKQFANHMVTDHTKSTAEVKAAARQAGLTVAPPKLNAMQAKMIADLRKASGPSRDRMYVTQQKKAHQMALTLHRDYAAHGQVAPLKAAAGSIAPVVQSHIDMLNRM